jgi:hypothetical protein
MIGFQKQKLYQGDQKLFNDNFDKEDKKREKIFSDFLPVLVYKKSDYKL